jgi:hypothetical protein
MTDTNADYTIDRYQAPKDENPFGEQLTKAKHKNPELHILGENLPSNIVAYEESSGTLQPDVGGNTPIMLRQIVEATPSGVNQVINSVTPTLLGGMIVVVTCPLQVSGSPRVRLSYGTQVLVNNLAGAPPNLCIIDAYQNGVLMNKLQTVTDPTYVS